MTPKITIQQLQRELGSRFNQFAQDLHQEIVRTTPVRTGQARRNWTRPQPVRSDNYDTVITENRLPYIIPLEQGSSQQAPRGFIQPAIDRTIRRYQR